MKDDMIIVDDPFDADVESAFMLKSLNDNLKSARKIEDQRRHREEILMSDLPIILGGRIVPRLSPSGRLVRKDNTPGDVVRGLLAADFERVRTFGMKSAFGDRFATKTDRLIAKGVEILRSNRV